MTGKEILQKMKVKVGLGTSVPETGKGKGKTSKHITHGFHLMKGKSTHPMEDYLVSEFKKEKDKELGLFAIFDGHLGHDVASYLQNHLFQNILKQNDFWTDTEMAVKTAYLETDEKILEQSLVLGRGGSTAVTAILIDGQKLVIANVGDSRAVVCENGKARQLSVDHEPSKEKKYIERRGGFVSNIPGDVPRVDGQLAVARAFGDKSLKMHLSSEPDVVERDVDQHTEFLILASDGIWKVMSNQEAVDSIRQIKDAQAAAKRLIEEAVSRKRDVPRVDGQLAVARAFGDKSLKMHLSSEPDVVERDVDQHTEFLILASDGIWKVMSNQEAVDSIRQIKDAQAAAKRLIEEAVSRKSKDDISCIVVKFQ